MKRGRGGVLILTDSKFYGKDFLVLMDPKFGIKCLLCAAYHDKHLGHTIRLQTIKTLTQKPLFSEHPDGNHTVFCK